eukprot:1137821-Pelagomonas_calceolata.AAC.4
MAGPFSHTYLLLHYQSSSASITLDALPATVNFPSGQLIITWEASSATVKSSSASSPILSAAPACEQRCVYTSVHVCVCVLRTLSSMSKTLFAHLLPQEQGRSTATRYASTRSQPNLTLLILTPQWLQVLPGSHLICPQFVTPDEQVLGTTRYGLNSFTQMSRSWGTTGLGNLLIWPEFVIPDEQQKVHH